MSGLLKLNTNDFVKGAVTAIFTAVVAVLWGASQQPDFNVFMLDWHPILNAAIYGFVGYLGKNFVTAENGKVFGKIG